MNSALLLITGVAIYFIAYVFYGRYLSDLFGIRPKNPTPAHKFKDGIDYVPTKAPVVFGHHFASIAGAGPIVGPVLGVCFGWVPVILWVIFGCVFIGAVHDFSALIVSVRNKGRSIGHIIERYIGYTGRQLFLFFCLAALILVIAVFTLFVSKTFVTTPSVASSSIYFVALALVFGFLTHRAGKSLFMSSLIFVPLLFFGVYLGIRMPLDLTVLFNISVSQAQQIWVAVLLMYCAVAAVVPVWSLLQPRDYLNSYLLYAMIILGFVSIVVVGPSIKMPAVTGLVITEPIKGSVRWGLFPILYVTVACGACSGFHALVASGTTSKQISSERHILPIGYGAMLVEGVIAIMAVISVAVLSKQDFAATLQTKGVIDAFASGIAGFSAKLGLPVATGETFIALTISAFILTTLDTATRLGRFTVQELCIAKRYSSRKKGPIAVFFKNRYIATFFVVVLAGYASASGGGSRIWPVFGAANQLLAALTLLLVTMILIKKKKNFLITFGPFLFMTIMSSWALGQLFLNNLRTRNWTLLSVTCFLMVMAGLMMVQAARRIFRRRETRRT